jgi:hypothetical protein
MPRELDGIEFHGDRAPARTDVKARPVRVSPATTALGRFRTLGTREADSGATGGDRESDLSAPVLRGRASLVAMSQAPTVLVEVSRGDVRAGITLVGGGEFWLALGYGAPLRPISLIADGMQAASIGGDGWLALGGRLPAAARAAHARDQAGAWRRAESGGGAWVLFVDSDEQHRCPAVRFSDAEGEIVSRAGAGELAIARRMETPEGERVARLGASIGGDCPVCGQREWRAVPSALGAGENIFCAICGHTDPGVFGTWTPRPPRPLDQSRRAG